MTTLNGCESQLEARLVLFSQLESDLKCVRNDSDDNGPYHLPGVRYVGAEGVGQDRVGCSLTPRSVRNAVSVFARVPGSRLRAADENPLLD